MADYESDVDRPIDNDTDAESDIPDLESDADNDEPLTSDVIDSYSTKPTEIYNSLRKSHEKYIPDKKRRPVDASNTMISDFMSKAIYVALINARASSILGGSSPFVTITSGKYDHNTLAKAELIHGVFPRAIILDGVRCRADHYIYYPDDVMVDLMSIKARSNIVTKNV